MTGDHSCFPLIASAQGSTSLHQSEFGLFFVQGAVNIATMKKISLLLLSLTMGVIVFAQNVDFGLKGGVNLSSLTNISNSDSKLGYHLGGLAHIHLNPQWALQPELVYSNQGVEYTSGGFVHKLNLDYVNIPVLFQYMAGSGFRLQTGPQIGFLTNVEDKINGNETNTFSTSDFKNTDFAWSFGLSYVGATGLGFDARYNLGLSNINNFGNNDLKNNVLQAGLFYQFNSGGGKYRK